VSENAETSVASGVGQRVMDEAPGRRVLEPSQQLDRGLDDVGLGQLGQGGPGSDVAPVFDRDETLKGAPIG
jgi:hypothetical protein